MPFIATLFKIPGKGGWTFVRVPDAEVPPIDMGPWGRAPVMATVDGVTYPTSVWHQRETAFSLSIPARIRRGKGDGDEVEVALSPRTT